MLQLPLTLLLLATASAYPPGRLSKEEALDRVAQHACLTSLAAEELADGLVDCVASFEHEVLWDDVRACDQHGVEEARLPACQAAVSRWMELERRAEVGPAFVALIKAQARCSSATVCRPAKVRVEASPRPAQ